VNRPSTRVAKNSTANSTATSKAPASKEKAGGRYKFNGKGNFNCEGWRSEDRRYKFNGNGDGNCCALDFGSHAADYVVYRDVAYGMLVAIYYC